MSPVSGAGATSGTGAVGGTVATGGTGAASGTTGGTTMVGGMSGGMTGGSAGVGATGGVGGGEPLVCESEADIRTGMACDEAAEGWFAIKTVADVWWDGSSTRDPGRGDIEIYLLGRLEDVCNDGSNGKGTIKACGTVLPPFTSDVACDAFQIEFPDAIWDSPMMPRFTTTGSTTAFTPGGLLTLNAATGLLGVDLMDGQEEGAWPGAAMTAMFPCEAGTGADCFPDHDGDGEAGITINLRHDEAVYVGPLQNGKCTSGADYKYRGAPTNGLDIGAGGGAGGGVRALNVRIGLRSRLGGAGLIAEDCMSGVGESTVDFLDSRALECIIDPMTLVAGDPRIASMDHDCTAAEATFVDENVPLYQVLPKDAVPGATMLPLGWGLAARDIDKSPSEGPKSALVRLGSNSDPEPSCETVRTATFVGL